MIVNSFSHEYLSEQLQDHSDVNIFCFPQLNHFNWHHFRVSHIPELFLFLQGFFLYIIIIIYTSSSVIIMSEDNKMMCSDDLNISTN